jgi:uncharacterized RDD family membrane protein YckC
VTATGVILLKINPKFIIKLKRVYFAVSPPWSTTHSYFFALTLGYGAVLLVIKVVFHGTQGLEEVQPGPLLQWLSLLGWLVCLSSYYYICWRKQGQTLGMKAWRLRLQQSNGDLATPSQCLTRSCLAPLSLGCFGIGYLWCLLPSQDDCLHDIFSDTVVVLLDK